MIYFITGAVNQGKSFNLINIYRSLGKGDGFYNRKLYRGDCFVGQEIVHLATGESRLFSLKIEFLPTGWYEECCYETFSFSREGLNFGRRIIENALENKINPVFIDEIGPLELEGKGFNEIFMKLLTVSVEIYIVVRKSCLMNVIKKYLITEYTVINTKSAEVAAHFTD